MKFSDSNEHITIQFFIIMAAILPSLSIDASAQKLSKYFLPWQVVWINDDSPRRLAEKSVRIGWTYADAFKNVRKRILFKNRDYLFATKDQPSAVEYVKTCEQHAKVFNLAKSILSRGEDSATISGTLPDGEPFTVEVKFQYLRFDNGSRIIAFSSNPYAMAVFGGDVGLDEFAKHPRAELLWETAQGRITWGYDLGMWSAHNGTDTLFYEFAQEARAGKGGWSYYRVTMEDAVAGGLVEKINEVRGIKTTREAFIQECKDRSRMPEVYEQSYNCNPTGSTSAIVPWSQLQQCIHNYEIPRVHLEATQIVEAFGSFTPGTQQSRELRIANYITSEFSPLIKTPAQYRLGFDVAASGEGDLAAIYIDRKEAPRLKLAGLFTCRTNDWNFLQTVLWTFHRWLPALKSAGDETGLGRQICWETAKRFPGQFTAVNFSSDKHDLGFALMNQLSVAEKIFPKSEPDVAQDFFALRKIFAGKTWKFTEGRNLLNPASHCDIAWSGALATKADATNTWGGGRGAILI
jgi:phage FluMu gp28-like protein